MLNFLQSPLFKSLVSLMCYFTSQMGYGSRALHLLQMYYEGKFPCLEEKVTKAPKEITTVSSEVGCFLYNLCTIFPVAVTFWICTELY